MWVFRCQEQFSLAIPSAPIGGGGCAWDSLDERLRAIDGACCIGRGEPGCAAPGAFVGGCTVACSHLLLPLAQGSCRPMIDVIYDTLDGRRDGTAAVFDTAAAACHSIPPVEALRVLGILDASGDCAANGVSLDGLATTPVPEPACADLMGADTCGQMLAIFSCEADFIVGGRMAGNCDATCHLCVSSGRGPPPPPPGPPTRPPRAPPPPPSPPPKPTDCTPRVFAAGADAVTEACCDIGDECALGVATVCDAKCALVYIDFYESCSGLLASYSASAAYRGLYTTCRDGLPLAPLLAAAAQCNRTAGGLCATNDRCRQPGTFCATRGCDACGDAPGQGGPPLQVDPVRFHSGSALLP